MTFTTFTPLLWLLLLLGAGWGYWRSLVDRPSRLKIASFMLRVFGVVLLVRRPRPAHQAPSSSCDTGPLLVVDTP